MRPSGDGGRTWTTGCYGEDKYFFTMMGIPAPDEPTRQHIHVVVRTSNGNDYGKDLLRQHLTEHAH